MTNRRTRRAAVVQRAAGPVAEATEVVVQDSEPSAVVITESLVEVASDLTPEPMPKVAEQAKATPKHILENTAMTMFQRYEDLNGFGKENVDAIVKSTTLLTKGLEELSQVLFKMTQENLESTLAVAKSALACTTLRQVIDFQNDLAKTSFDKLMAETNKVSELSLKVANDALEPIQARVNVAIEKLVKPVAA